MIRYVRMFISLILVSAGLFCTGMCIRMIGHAPVRYPVVWVIGLIVFLVFLVIRLSRMNACERYTMERFERQWIEDRKTRKGLMYRDKPGCYAILIYRFPKILPFTAGYSNVYVGQSLDVYHRVHNHLNRKGNGDVYADVRDGKHIELEIYPCRKEKLNELEIRLIRRYDAEAYYNRTAGGGTHRKRW